MASQLVLRGLCAGLDEDAPCYAVLLSVHDRERSAAPATPRGPNGASLPAKAKHSNRCVTTRDMALCVRRADHRSVPDVCSVTDHCCSHDTASTGYIGTWI